MTISTVPNETLKDFISGQGYGVAPSAVVAICEELLAVREAQSVLVDTGKYTSEELVNVCVGRMKAMPDDCAAYQIAKIAHRALTAPPAPAVPPIMKGITPYCQGWNECRAAMLVSGVTDGKPVTGNSPVIPDGWKLVPAEPTKEMIDAGWCSFMGSKNPSSKGTYLAMLAAAPTPTKAAPAEPVSEPYKLPAELPPNENESYGSEDDCYKAGKVDGWNEYRATMLASVSTKAGE
jgi:hypothetical protein